MEIENDLIVIEDQYKFKLDNFEGPLDLLLHLIKGSKLDIYEVNLSEITEQYLSYMTQLETLDMERAADFIEMAATLLEIKSKALLPQEDDEEELEEVDQEQLLLRRLQEYKMLKEAGEKMGVIENVDRFYKSPDKQAGDYRVILADMNLQGLISAFTGLLTKIDKDDEITIPKTIEKDRFTVEEKTFELQTRLIKERRIKFSQLVDIDYSRSEIITIFLALLEMLKRQEILVEQTEQFGEIEIIKCEEEVGEYE
ncbi:MAG: segregation/condensation protein A [Tenericutes bacterium HGW-Tenericutes-4]|jgi:segregation and condensation protein A|nr:MAG: segregation/condensation protein A [Tenericutes bacterium HGW-Tenericutes-4]